MSDIKAILFDFGGTLDSDGHDWFVRFRQGVIDQGVAVDHDDFNQAARWAADHLATLPDATSLSLSQTADRLCELIHRRFVERRNNGPVAWDYRRAAESFVADATRHLRRNREVIARLHENFRLGCISNNWGNAAGWCRQYGFDEFFDVVIDSTQVGTAKPDRAIFQAALDALGLEAGQCVYVGDRYVTDVLGSRAAGFVPVWVAGDRTQANDQEWVNPRCIESLPELLELSW
jgi:HAD superfamily hydrolase (TIGR01549 family)